MCTQLLIHANSSHVPSLHSQLFFACKKLGVETEKESILLTHCKRINHLVTCQLTNKVVIFVQGYCRITTESIPPCYVSTDK